ncbi:hypothetical protein OAF13_00410 [Akkermansiaceae bacterium]|nr:hypothetical protein [Akkermansiaceae bacterium]
MKLINSTENFKKDLQRGRKIEEKILDICRQKYPCSVLIDGKFKDYDLFIPETNKKLEIKGDYRSCETGNIIIELMMFGKPSALLTTKADFWVVYTGLELLWITPIKIIECITVNNINSRTLTGQGDTASKVACLIPIETFKKYCFKIENS